VSPHTRRSVALIYVASLVQGAFNVVLPASSAVLKVRLGLSDTLYGALFLPWLGLALATSLLAPVLLRRLSLRRLFIAPLACEAAALALMAAAGWAGRGAGLPLLLFSVALAGPSLGLLGISMNTAAIELFPARRDGALAALHGVLGIGAAVWPLAIGWAAARGIWPVAPLIVASAFLALVFAMAGRPIRGLAEGIETRHARDGLPRGLLARGGAAMLYGIGEATLTAWAVVFLYERRGLSIGVATGALSAFWFAMTGGRLLGAMLARWISARALSLVLCAAMAGSFLLVARAQGSVNSVLAFAFAGLSCSALFPMLFAMASGAYPDRTPQVSSCFTTAILAGLAIGSFGVGPLRAIVGLDRIYLASALGPIATGILIAVIERRRRNGV
jgi:hypothetical protein